MYYILITKIFPADSLFSLIIFIYVSVTFLYMFYAFCWREEHPQHARLMDTGNNMEEEEEEKEEVTQA